MNMIYPLVGARCLAFSAKWKGPRSATIMRVHSADSVNVKVLNDSSDGIPTGYTDLANIAIHEPGWGEKQSKSPETYLEWSKNDVAITGLLEAVAKERGIPLQSA